MLGMLGNNAIAKNKKGLVSNIVGQLRVIAETAIKCGSTDVVIQAINGFRLVAESGFSHQFSYGPYFIAGALRLLLKGKLPEAVATPIFELATEIKDGAQEHNMNDVIRVVDECLGMISF